MKQNGDDSQLQRGIIDWVCVMLKQALSDEH